VSTDERIDYAEWAARDAGLTGEQVASMQAWLLGAILTNFDTEPPLPLWDSRWRHLVREAVRHATNEPTEGRSDERGRHE
jgi:hypothetical protein